MDRDNLHERLSGISTLWSAVFRAHQSITDAAATAQSLLVQRYSGTVYRYLLGALHDPEAAEELCQEFALRFVRGDFCGVDPERGPRLTQTQDSHYLYIGSRVLWPAYPSATSLLPRSHCGAASLS